jgi:radical SAM superfamily enzyme YgiQ (UPF0313 family)
MELLYDYPLYRPPSEANSLIFQVTLGCSFNKCSFCNMYRTKQYVERSWGEIKNEIDLAHESQPDASRIFLADGDALSLSTSRLIQILEYLQGKFSKLERISCYAMPRNLIQKNPSELSQLKRAGLGMLYVGIETGNDLLLKRVTKGATSRGIIQGCIRAKECGFTLSCMVILGLGGKKYTQDHIKDTARVLSDISPHYLGALTLILEEGIYAEFMTKFGEKFEHLDDFEILDELQRLIEFLQPNSPIVFRANHASNIYSVGGTLPEDKGRLTSLIMELRRHPEKLKPKVLRRF